jgi:uncharacterized protein (DUF1501 family)
MLRFEGKKGVRQCDGLTRREFLRVGALSAGAVGLSLADLAALHAADKAGVKNCILLFLVGGPSQLDTWDLKPSAPENVRGPFRPIKTNVPGVEICEHFPRMARMADCFALVRSVHHDAAPIHETGHQLMQTGHLFQNGVEHPHYGAVLSHLYGERVKGVPPFAVVPGPIGYSGVSVSHGQTAGYLGDKHEPMMMRGEHTAGGFQVTEFAFGCADPVRPDDLRRRVDAAEATLAGQAAAEEFWTLFSPKSKAALDVDRDSDASRGRYGLNTFGQSCLLARRMVEHGVRLVTVNMFDTVFDNLTWDCHADGGSLPTRLEDYRDVLCPMFDQAYSALLDDLHQRGLLDDTLVLALGEFGRTPPLNPRGGRDHWPGVWTILFAGGGVRGGQVVGSSDRIGAEPKDRPVTPAEVAATVYQALGVDLNTRLPGPESRPMPLVEAAPIHELFA